MNATVPARRVEDFAHAKNAGDFFIQPPNPADRNRIAISFLCPCGCGMLAGVRVNEAGTTDDYCWSWNKDCNKPTVQPSILINDNHWHGFLTDGVFRGC